MIRDSSRKSDRVPRSSLQHRIRSPADAERPGNLAGADFVSLRAASTFSYALHPNVGVWLPSYIERLALAPLESVAETMRARVGVRSSLRRSFKDKLGWKPARILSRKDWHCVQDRAVVSWPRPGTEIRLDPAPPASLPLRGFGGDGGNRRRQPNGGSREIDRHPIVAPVSGFTARRPCP